MKEIEEYTPSELAALATVLGLIIASKFNANQQNVIGNFLEAVGQIILTIAAQAQNIQSQAANQGGDNGKSNSSANSMDLQKQIDELREYIEKFEDNKKC